MRSSFVLALTTVALVTSACASAPAPAVAPAPAPTTPPAPPPAPEPVATEAPKPMGPQLTATPDDKLGTAPANLGLKIGAKAPSMTLPEARGGTVKLAEVYAKGPTFVVFYRGGWCPFCNLQVHQLQAAKKDFDAKGVNIVAISVDKPTEEAKMQAKQEATFPFLSDPKLAAHKAFNVVHVPGADEKAGLAKYGVDLESYSGEKHGNFAVPAVFLVDRKGIVRFVHIDDDYKTRPSPAQLLAVVEKNKL